MSKLLKAHIALLGANVIYGANYTIAKGVMPDYIEPFGFILTRALGAVILFWLVAMFFPKEKVAKKDLLLLAICGLFGVATNQLLFFKGLNITSPINAGIIMTSNPILVLVAASILLKERLTKNKISGIVLGLTGACLLILFKGDLSISTSTLPGDLMVFLNSISYGVYLVLVAPLMRKYSSITVIKWVFLFGLLYILPIGFNEFKAIEWQTMPTNMLLSVMYVVVFTTFFTYLLNIYSLKHVSPSIASTYIYLQPVLATIFAIWLGMDSLDWIKVASTILIFTGVYLVSKPLKAKQ